MLIREPLVHAVYFYLREAPGDNPDRRRDRHAAFVSDTQRMLQSVSGWLAMAPPAIPEIPVWHSAPPHSPQPIMQTGELQGKTNASAWLTAYALRNMLLLRVVVSRPGEHDVNVWSMLDESLGNAPTTPSWLSTTRYWCGLAPRPPEDLEHDRLMPIKTPFGVLLLGQAHTPHLLVYPDARTEHRATQFLRSLASQLDWYTVQARYSLEQYENRVTNVTRTQQQALEQVSQSVQAWWNVGRRPDRLRSLAPLHNQLDTLEKTYEHVLSDLAATRGAAQQVRGLMAEYRLTLMQSGLWDAAPSVWEAQVDSLSSIQGQIEADVAYIDTMLRRTDLMIRGLQTRIALLQGERERLLVYIIAVLGMSILAVLVADVSLSRMVIRVLALAFVMGVVWTAWQTWLQSRLP